VVPGRLTTVSTLAAPTDTLFARARSGDGEALDDLLRAHRDSITAVCRRRLRSRVDADDAVQETMLRAMGALGAVRDETRLRSYLCRIAERVCLDMMRAGARPMPTGADVLSQDAPSANEPESLTIRREEAELVRRTLQALSERQAEALWLRDAMGEPVPAVAEHLGMTEGSTRVLLARARRRMRDDWSKVAALFPGLGLKLPAPLAKLVATTGLVPAVVAPAAVLVAAVLVLPSLGGTAVDTPPGALAVPLTTPSAVQRAESVTSVPLTTAVTDPVAGPRPAAATSPRSVPAEAAAPAETRVSTGAADVAIDRDDPQDDDVTAGDEEIIGIGTSVQDTLDGVGLDAPAAQLSPAELED
jgi:RNA polymerase sigma factor (sigma-70 family)